MRKIFEYVVLFLILAFNIYVLHLYERQIVATNIISHENHLLNVKLNRSEDLFKCYNEILNSSLDQDIIGEFLNQSVRGLDGVDVCVKDLISKGTLFFIYSEYSCSPCVEKQIEIINSLASSISKTDIIILTNYEDDLKFKKFCTINKIGVRVYNGSKVSLFLNKYSIPYFFEMNNKFKIKNVFFPDKSSDENTFSYLETVN